MQAGGLQDSGIRPGERVAIALPNNLEMIVAFLASAKVGAAAPLNQAYTRDEFRFYLQDTGACRLILPVADSEEAAKAAAELQIGIHRIEFVSEDELRFAHAATRASDLSSDAPSEETALILHTSGTTSRPKRVPLSHENLLSSTRTVASTYRLDPKDVSFCVMPLFHIHGLVASTLATLYTGGTVVLAGAFNALSFWRHVRDYNVTWYSAVPTIHQMLLSRSKSRPEGAELLRFIRSCSAPLVPATMNQIEERFGAPVLEAYGMTEAAHQMSSNPLPPAERRPATVGVATGVRIAILDKQGNELPPGSRGEVCIQGPNVMGGYESNPQANAESFVRGWFRTGDEGSLAADGYLTLLGRIKEIINRGGEKVSPREVDEILVTHPEIAEAVTFGIPDRVYGEEVAAAVVVRDAVTESELISHCKQKLADFKCPKSIYFVERIPRTATGKIQRRAVAEKMLEERG